MAWERSLRVCVKHTPPPLVVHRHVHAFRLPAVPPGARERGQVECECGEDEEAEPEVEGGDQERDGYGEVGRRRDQLEDEEPEEAAQRARAAVHDPQHRPGLQ